MNRSVPVLAVAVASLVSPAVTPLFAVAEAAHTSAAGRSVVGNTSRMKWGKVTVRLLLDSRGKRIVNVTATLPTERPRSKKINNRAAPILRSEVLQAQSARIHAVSGATMTSKSYIASLSSALGKAHL
jgi:uncharacterized protein with FMN-binding domain